MFIYKTLYNFKKIFIEKNICLYIHISHNPRFILILYYINYIMQFITLNIISILLNIINSHNTKICNVSIDLNYSYI